MNIRQILIIAAAIAINVLVLASFHAWTVAGVASATPPARSDKVITLPTINVYPSQAELRVLRAAHTPRPSEQASVSSVTECAVMPYYSFAAACSAAVVG